MRCPSDVIPLWISSNGDAPDTNRHSPQDEVNTSGQLSVAQGWIATAGSLGVLYASDYALKMLFKAQAWTFPAPLAGMFVIIGGLLAVAQMDEKAAERIVDTFRRVASTLPPSDLLEHTGPLHGRP